MDKFFQSLAQLLPTGFAWPRDPSSTLMRVVRGVSASFAELHAYTLFVAGEWLPHKTTTRLTEWEAATGLPCDCFGAAQTLQQRSAQLTARLCGPDLAYTDSSPASPGALIAIAKRIGYDNVTVAYNTPLRVGVGQVGQRLGALDGKLYVRVATASTLLRVGTGVAGQRLWDSALPLGPLDCYLKRLAPARFAVDVGLAA
ncbi:putative phage tail protein [Limnohabitans sp.]|uniref:putative phage tail protein n=1 Tax=Limnohabitans sp. TaxID=1907725 RepID=UPI00286EC758|nr:putative phage tail protein [Limnohabitans sp.]